MKKGTKPRRRSPSSESTPELPRATEAERVLIGWLLLSDSSKEHVLRKLRPQYFYNQSLRCIYSRLTMMSHLGETLDLPTLVDELQAHDELEDAGGAPYVSSLTDGIPRKLSLDAYINALREKYAQRQLAKIGEEIRETALKTTSARETLIAAERKISDVRTALRSSEFAQGNPPCLAELLNTTAAFVRRFVVMSPAQSDVVALWIFHTHAISASDVTGYVWISSAEKRCGKTRLLETLELLVSEPWLTGRVTAAVLVRKMDKIQPTLLLDETDAALNDESEYSDALRGILNLGYRRGGRVSMCVGRENDIKDFCVFGPKAIAGIGSLPDTIVDRSFRIRLERRTSDEQVESFARGEIEPIASLLRRQIEALASTSSLLDTLKSSKLEPLAELGDRENEIADPLRAIADAAGAEWSQRARSALLTIFQSGSVVRDESVKLRLLRDIARVFQTSACRRISTNDLLSLLNADDEAPWHEFSRGKGLNAHRLSKMLAEFGIRPQHFRDGSETIRGYIRSAFVDVWRRFCESPPPMSGTAGTSGTDNLFNNLHVPDENPLGDTSRVDKLPGPCMSLKTNGVPGVPLVPVPGMSKRTNRGDETPEGPESK